jgi:hypothetical protein
MYVLYIQYLCCAYLPTYVYCTFVDTCLYEPMQLIQIFTVPYYV